jgi:hypothetical protein
MAWLLNKYRCARCNRAWEDEWSAACDDDCPRCGARHIEPYDSVDLTEIVEEENGKFRVYRSPDSAEGSADYELIAECDTKEEADEFLRNIDEEPEDGDGQVGFVD